MASKEHLLLLFDRPQEPAFMPKGEKKIAFNIPNDYLEDKYKPLGIQLNNRFAEETREKIPVKQISIPSLDDVLELKRHDNFSLFIPKHREIAGKLIDIFMGMKNVEDLLSMALYARDRVNPYLFNYAYSVALLHRPDTQNLDIPSFVTSFPDKFSDPGIFIKARQEARIVPEGSRMPVEIPKDFTASDLEEEHRIAYFREDLGVNLHHWHWHLVYPYTSNSNKHIIVAKDRRGELFYYMHQQIIARYNFERFSNKLKRVERFTEWKEPLREGYFPKLNSNVASRGYPGRTANQKLQDLNRVADKLAVDVKDLERWRDRIADAIQKGFVTNEKDEKIYLTETKGIDILGDVIEASDLSPHPSFYGNLHNIGHAMIAYIHDPDHRYLENFGVMGDVATAMRDPAFYRWHSFVDSLFQSHKAKLVPYTEDQLNHPGITITKVKLQSEGKPANTLNTFWQISDVDLSSGMDFQDTGSVPIRFTHLQHQPFNYTITVNNQTKANKMATCRIYLTPKFDERGEEWLFREQKTMFIELDKFTVPLKQGQNTITRASTQSSVTIPFQRSFRSLYVDRPKDGDPLAEFNFCGCGWPHHMLIPKGSPEGMSCQLFVMLSNYDDDKVVQDTEGACNDAGSYCGIKDKLYPDKRPMGYPLDRLPRKGVETLQDFLTPNMYVQEITINHLNITVRRKQTINN